MDVVRDGRALSVGGRGGSSTTHLYKIPFAYYYNIIIYYDNALSFY